MRPPRSLNWIRYDVDVKSDRHELTKSTVPVLRPYRSTDEGRSNFCAPYQARDCMKAWIAAAVSARAGSRRRYQGGEGLPPPTRSQPDGRGPLPGVGDTENSRRAEHHGCGEARFTLIKPTATLWRHDKKKAA